MGLYQVVYASAVVGGLRPEELQEIIAQGRRNNLRDGLTGRLVASPSGFVQILEGPKSAVRNCLNRISTDARHRGLAILRETDVRHRMFPDCPLEYEWKGEFSLSALSQEAMGLIGEAASDDAGAEPDFLESLRTYIENDERLKRAVA